MTGLFLDRPSLGLRLTSWTSVSAFVTALLILPLLGHATQDDSRLEPMFDKLRMAETSVHARMFEQQIWQIWSEADNRTSRELLRDGARAMASRNFTDALEKFNRLIAHDPDFAEGWNKRATLYYLMGEFDASVRDIERTLALEPRHFGALSGLGLIFMATGNNEAAIVSFEKALEINPHMASAKYHIDGLKRRQAGAPT